MGLFICENCFCVENTASGRYWTRHDKGLWADDNLNKALCSECAPTQFKSGAPHEEGGKWHGLFEKTFPTREEIEKGITYAGCSEPNHYLNKDVVLALLDKRKEVG